MSGKNIILWARYKLYCYNRGLAEGNFKSLEQFFYNEKLRR